MWLSVRSPDRDSSSLSSKNTEPLKPELLPSAELKKNHQSTGQWSAREKINITKKKSRVRRTYEVNVLGGVSDVLVRWLSERGSLGFFCSLARTLCLLFGFSCSMRIAE